MILNQKKRRQAQTGRPGRPKKIPGRQARPKEFYDRRRQARNS